MKHALALLCLALLTACGSGGGGGPVIADIQARNLYYGVQAEFIVSGSNLATLDNGIVPTIANCTPPTPASMVLGQLVFACSVTAAGELGVQIRDKSGALIFAKTFTVPAPQVSLDTTMGTMVVELNPGAAPISVNNFLNYVQLGYYSNTLFHRVVAAFVIQGGGFTAGLVARPQVFAPIALESNNGLTNKRGSIAMARTADANSATSQFYFNLVDNPALDYQDAANPGYAVFGKIVQGLEVMDAIGAVATTTVNGIADVPLTDVLVNSAVRKQ